jgi:hypothetical protein
MCYSDALIGSNHHLPTLIFFFIRSHGTILLFLFVAQYCNIRLAVKLTIVKIVTIARNNSFDVAI